MNTLDILERLSTTLPVRVCVTALDQLPEPVYPAAFIINFDTGNLPGTHWVLIILDRDVVFFDPLCIEPVPDLLSHWFSRFIDVPVFMNNRPVQHPLSITCGAHVIFVAEKHFVNNLPIDTILSHCYSSSLHENDSLVVRRLQIN